MGKLQRVRIGHDNSGLFAGWHLQDVCIKAVNEPEVHFDLPVGGRWFATDEDDGQVFGVFRCLVITYALVRPPREFAKGT